MGRTPLRILLCADESAAAYLETVLEMEDPTMFQAERGGNASEPWALAGFDVALVALDGISCNAFPTAGGDVPYIVVPSWHPGLAEVDQWIRQGADDVLALSDLNARRLAAAVVKAVERRGRDRAGGVATAAWSSLADGSVNSYAFGGEAARFLVLDDAPVES